MFVLPSPQPKSPREEVVEIFAESLLWLALHGLRIDNRRATERNIAVCVVIGKRSVNGSESR